MHLPSLLAASVSAWPGTTAAAWVEALPDMIRTAEQRWSITLHAPFEPGGVTSYVAPATTAAGEPVVYKCTIPHDEARDEAVALAAYAGNGAVRVVASEPATWELLLERCEPGTSLWDIPDRADRSAIAASVLRRLWEAPAARAFTSLTDASVRRAGTIDRVLMTDVLPWVTEPLERGADLLRTLPRDAESTVLLHQDLHPGNILSAAREPWLAIDPKPLVGDPAFDPVQLITQEGGRNVEPPPVSEVEARIASVAGLLDLDGGRLAHWTLARCAEWCAWSWDAGDIIDASIEYTWARLLDALI